MWLKVLVCALIVAFCVAMGYVAAGKYRARSKFFAQFENFNERYLSELAYARKPLSGFLAEKTYTGDFAKVVAGAGKGSPPALKLSFLTKEEKGDCEDYFAMLGKGDSHSQSGYFSAKKSYLSEKKSESEKEAKSRGSLYLKLGLLAGLAFVILIV